MDYKELDETLEEINESVENLEVINEDNLLSKDGFMLSINPTFREGPGFYLDPYVKVYDAENYFKARNCLRVHIIDGRCEHHNDDKGGLPISHDLKKFLKKNLTQNVYDNIFEILHKVYDNYSKTSKAEIDALYAQHDEVFDFDNIYWGGGKVRNYRRLI